MSKANQKFVQADEAVSPVIGVILMVAITVVLAAVVFVLVSNLSKTSGKSEEAAVQVTSPSANVISVTLIKTGEHAPYSLQAPCNVADPAPNCASIAINGQTCTPAEMTGSGTTTNGFSSGQGIRITGHTGTASGCKLFTSGTANVQVTVTVASTVIYDSAIDAHQ